MRLLEENKRGNLLSVESGNDFLDMTPKVKQKKKKRMLINWTSAEFKVFVHQRIRVKSKPTKWKKVSANDTLIWN